MKYIVLYTIERYLNGEDNRDYYRPEGRTLIVYGDNKVQAFIAAYQQLTEQGHMVSTLNSLPQWLDEYGNQHYDWGLAGLTSSEMEDVYKFGVPKVSPGYDEIAMTHIKEIYESPVAVNDDNTVSAFEVADNSSFIDPIRLDQLRAITSSEFDLMKLIRLCEEIDNCYANDCYFAVAILTRAILDHVPPVFGFKTFQEVVSNYGGTRSFRDQIGHLENSSRKIADSHLHTMIRKKETLPTKTQVNFANDIDVLLAEIVRILK